MRRAKRVIHIDVGQRCKGSREPGVIRFFFFVETEILEKDDSCLLYTSDAADERSRVDLGGRRIINKKHSQKYTVGNDTSKKKTTTN